MAKFAQRAQTVFYNERFTFGTPVPDRHVIAIGPYSKLPGDLQVRMPFATFETLASVQKAAARTSIAPERTCTKSCATRSTSRRMKCRKRLRRRDLFPKSPAAWKPGEFSYLACLTPPKGSTRWALVLTAFTPEQLLAGTEAIVETSWWQSIEGDVVRWSVEPPVLQSNVPVLRHLAARQRQFVEMPFGESLDSRVWLSLVAAGLLALAIATIAVLNQRERGHLTPPQPPAGGHSSKLISPTVQRHLPQLVSASLLLFPSLSSPAAEPPSPWLAFRDRFILPEGRVVDYANDRVSHSESQGYGLLLAEAHDDRETFDRVLSWTTRHLKVRGDELHAWRWKPNIGVDDKNNATGAAILRLPEVPPPIEMPREPYFSAASIYSPLWPCRKHPSLRPKPRSRYTVHEVTSPSLGPPLPLSVALGRRPIGRQYRSAGAVVFRPGFPPLRSRHRGGWRQRSAAFFSTPSRSSAHSGNCFLVFASAAIPSLFAPTARLCSSRSRQSATKSKLRPGPARRYSDEPSPGPKTTTKRPTGWPFPISAKRNTARPKSWPGGGWPNIRPCANCSATSPSAAPFRPTGKRITASVRASSTRCAITGPSPATSASCRLGIFSIPASWKPRPASSKTFTKRSRIVSLRRACTLAVRGPGTGRASRDLARQYGGPLQKLYAEFQAKKAFDQALYLRAYALAQEAGGLNGKDGKGASLFPDLTNIDSPTIGFGAGIRFKTGESGLSKLRETSIGIRGTLVVKEVHRVEVDINSVSLESGRVSGNALIGSAPLEPTARGDWRNSPTVDASGLVTARVRYTREGTIEPYVDLGFTPNGAELSSTIVGDAGVKVHTDWGYLQGDIYRDAIKESMLSYVGIRDPYSDRLWGRVTESGLKLSLYAGLPDDWSIFVSASGGALVGEGVDSNTHFRLSLAASKVFKSAGFEYVTLGPTFSYEHFEKNLSFFTYGHGGYFSPDGLVQGTIGTQFLSAQGERWLAKGNVQLGFQAYQQKEAPSSPGPRRQLLHRVQRPDLHRLPAALDQ